jgi:hypothetical protein
MLLRERLIAILLLEAAATATSTAIIISIIG